MYEGETVFLFEQHLQSALQNQPKSFYLRFSLLKGRVLNAVLHRPCVFIRLRSGGLGQFSWQVLRPNARVTPALVK